MNKLFLLGLSLVFISILAGCYMNPLTLRINPPEDVFITCNISVTSEPSSAGIYYNDRLIGRTPAESLPVMIKMIRKYDPIKSWLTLPEQPYLRVSKEGYKDEVIPLEMKIVNYNYTSQLEKTNYHFVLEKED